MKKLPLFLCLFALAGCNGSGSEPGNGNAMISGGINAAAATGPALEVPVAQLEQALTCSSDLATAGRDPVLLTPAFSTDQESFGWNYLRLLPTLGIPTCSISVPDHGFGDLQTSAEYVVYAVRKMSVVSGRKVILFGHQHGPLDELWALTFWPDIASRVSSLISLATPYHGTTEAQFACNTGMVCPPSVWQIATGSRFLEAINRKPLPAGIGYTSIATQFDELITPQPAASHIDGGASIILQDICPGRLIEHFTILADNLAYELVLDAINHPGVPADVTHIDPSICSGPVYMPGVTDPQSAAAALQGITGFLSGFLLAFPQQGVNAEPALRDYAVAD